MSGIISIVLAGVFWGTVGLFARFLEGHGLHPFYIVILRTAVAVLCLGCYLLLFQRDWLKIKKEDGWRFLLAGFVSIVLTHPALFLALRANAIAVATILLYTAPFYTIILSRFIYNEAITRQKIIALFLAVAGLLLVVNVFDLKKQLVTPLGLILGLGAGLLQGIQTLTMKNVSLHYPPVTALFYSFASGLAILWVILLLGRVPMPLNLLPKAWAGALGIGLVTTLTPFLLFAHGLKRTEAGIASIASMLEPVAAGIFGYLILGERLEFAQILGMALMLVGIAVVAVSGKEQVLDRPVGEK
jgi:drug/metabolite transporter (DMT)-like permease